MVKISGKIFKNFAWNFEIIFMSDGANLIPYQTGVAACQAFQDWLLFLQLVSSVVPHLLQSFLHPMLPEMIFVTYFAVSNLLLLPVYHSIQHQVSQKWTIRCEYKSGQVSGLTNDFNFVILPKMFKKACLLVNTGWFPLIKKWWGHFLIDSEWFEWSESESLWHVLVTTQP